MAKSVEVKSIRPEGVSGVYTCCKSFDNGWECDCAFFPSCYSELSSTEGRKRRILPRRGQGHGADREAKGENMGSCGNHREGDLAFMLDERHLGRKINVDDNRYKQTWQQHAGGVARGSDK